MLLQTIPTSKDKSGNGKYRPLKRAKKAVAEVKSNEFDYLDRMDTRMRFNNAKDPIYFAFDCLEQRSVAQLAGDFVKDTFFEITHFVSKVVK